MPEPGECDTQTQCLFNRFLLLLSVFLRSCLLQQKVERRSQILLFSLQWFHPMDLPGPLSLSWSILGVMGHHSMKVRRPEGKAPLARGLLGDCQVIGCVRRPCLLQFLAMLQTLQPVLADRLQ